MSKWLFPMLMLINPTALSAEPNEISLEYKVKAAYLINFMLYVENKGKDNKERNLCIYGRDTFGEFIHQVLEGKNKKYKDLNTRIIYLHSGGQAEHCQSLFISSDDRHHINLKELSKNVLTIGEDSGFLSAGGMINLFLENDRVYFEINIDIINESDITLSSQLLKLARPARKW